MYYSVVKFCYGSSLLGGLLASIALTRSVVNQTEGGDSLLQLGVGAAVAVLVLKEVFAFIRSSREDNKDALLHKIHSLLIRIDEKLSKK